MIIQRILEINTEDNNAEDGEECASFRVDDEFISETDDEVICIIF